MSDAQNTLRGVPVVVADASGGAFVVGAMAAAQAPKSVVVLPPSSQPDDCPMLDQSELLLESYMALPGDSEPDEAAIPSSN